MATNKSENEANPSANKTTEALLDEQNDILERLATKCNWIILLLVGLFVLGCYSIVAIRGGLK